MGKPTGSTSLILPANFPLCLSVSLSACPSCISADPAEATGEHPGESSIQAWSGTVLVRKVILSITLSWPRSQSYSRCRPLLILPTPGQRRNDNKPVCSSGGMHPRAKGDSENAPEQTPVLSPHRPSCVSHFILVQTLFSVTRDDT